MQSRSFASTSLTFHPVLRAISRGVLGTAGILWVAMAASLCGCSPMNGWAMNQHGKTLYKQGDYRSARSEFERALMDSPYSADYAFNVAAAMDRQGDHLAAEKMYRHALTLDPSHQPAYHGMAAMLMQDGRSAEASDLINTWAATQPDSPDATTELGWLKAEQGDIDGADVELRKALRDNPRNTRALRELARAHRKSGRRGDAAADYARALYMDPDQPETQAELASMGNEAYGDPALQMAAAMPIYDPMLQPAAYPAFTSPQSQPQPHLAQGVDFDFNVAGGQPGNLPQAQWAQSPPQIQMMNGMSPNPTMASPNMASTRYGVPQQYNAARPTSSLFFQPQQSFSGVPSGEMLTSTPVPTPDASFSQQAEFNEAPTWEAGPTSASPTMIPGDSWSTAPAMNASYGSSTPAAQISGVPVVPAF